MYKFHLQLFQLYFCLSQNWGGLTWNLRILISQRRNVTRWIVFNIFFLSISAIQQKIAIFKGLKSETIFKKILARYFLININNDCLPSLVQPNSGNLNTSIITKNCGMLFRAKKCGKPRILRITVRKRASPSLIFSKVTPFFPVSIKRH